MDGPAIPPVRSMTSSVGVAVAGDTDMEGTALRLGCGVFSSSSEEMTYTARDGVLRPSSVDCTTVNPQVYTDQKTHDSGMANNAKWRI